jgi:AcrR family transcriptional regulator
MRTHGYRRVTIDDVAEGAHVGKGTVYLHWKTREALFWAVLQRDAVRLFDHVLGELSADPGLAFPHRLMRLLYLELEERPLVRALLTGDSELLGRLAEDESVRVAQAELSGGPDYLRLVADQGLLRDGLTPATAGYVLGAILCGFFASRPAEALPPRDRADLLADVVRRSLEPEGEPPAGAVAALNAQVTAMFAEMAAAHREQLERAY